MGGKRMPPLAGLDGPPHAAARRPGRLGSAHPSARSLEATARIGAGAYGEVFHGTVCGTQPVAVKTLLRVTVS